MWTAVLTPDGPTAQQWAEDELSRAPYQSYSNPLARIFTRFFEWLLSFFTFSGNGVGASPFWIITVCAIVLLVLFAIFARPLLLKPRGNKNAIFDGAVSVQELQATLRESVASGNWSQAVIAQFRLVVKLLDEHDVVEDTPGLTALEAAEQVASIAPLCAASMSESARIFNGVRYGEVQATQADYLQIVDTEKTVAGVRPQRQEVAQ